MKNMRKQLKKLLNIHAVSSNEKPVRDYLKPVLTHLMDDVVIDSYGNLLGEKVMGNGEGATVLLSAHMDTVKGVRPDKQLVEKNGIINAELPDGSPAILGADDRAGIAIVLAVLRNLDKISFNGKILVAFSREEEIGCVGADKIDSNWYKDADLAIVVDRRGNRDIVVGCGMAFCSDEVGLFMEDVSKLCDMDWKCVEGGVSDAMSFSSGGQGVNSINLSAGYMNEHTDREYVSIEAMRDTVRLIMQALAVINEHCVKFGEVPYENRWVKSWGATKGSSYYRGGRYYEDAFENDIWAEEYDTNGDVFVYEIGRDVVIQQGENEIVLSRESLRGLVDQLKDV